MQGYSNSKPSPSPSPNPKPKPNPKPSPNPDPNRSPNSTLTLTAYQVDAGLPRAILIARDDGHANAPEEITALWQVAGDGNQGHGWVEAPFLMPNLNPSPSPDPGPSPSPSPSPCHNPTLTLALTPTRHRFSCVP